MTTWVEPPKIALSRAEVRMQALAFAVKLAEFKGKPVTTESVVLCARSLEKYLAEGKSDCSTPSRS